jgi:hypothetical protein
MMMRKVQDRDTLAITPARERIEWDGGPRLDSRRRKCGRGIQ